MDKKKIIGWVIVLAGIVVAIGIILWEKPVVAIKWGLLFGVVFGVTFSVSRYFITRRK